MNEQAGQALGGVAGSVQVEAKMTVSGYMNRSRDSVVALDEQLEILWQLIKGQDGETRSDPTPSNPPIDPNRFLSASGELSDHLGRLLDRAKNMVIYFRELYGG